MDLRRFVRGTIPWPKLERVAMELRRRYDRPQIRVEFLDAENWLSTPCVVDEEFFVKIISPQNALVHAVFTGARNLGAVSTGSPGFFEGFEGPYEMAVHDLEAMRQLREIGVNAPEPLEAFRVGDFGVVVLEFLPSFRTIEDLDTAEIAARSPEVFAALSRMHEHHLVHGDLRGENILVYDDELYFIDVTKIRDGGIGEAAAYDLACALAEMAAHLGTRQAVDDAVSQYDIDRLLAARDFLDVVRLRPDHDFDAARVKGEIEMRASRAARR